MKLVSLYIENFGGLSEYSLTFSEGLTAIQQPNGFGKTTLAEFIRAMFYGFPRKAKTLDKSKRQKYTPWQGGKFGGNLVFEVQGERYRIERTFGATPKGDTFTLIDLGTNKKSDRFSEAVGLELFQLDADSFERSTYMPQLHDLTSLTTDSIQAKLGDLVEDTGDVGNYDKAVAALKAARSGYIPYRGSGGTVAEAQGQISRLRGELERTGEQRQALSGAEAEIARLEEELESCRQEKELICQRLDIAVKADSLAAVHREYGRLTAAEAQQSAALEELHRRYPKGVPSGEAIEEARKAAAEAAVLAAQTVTTKEDTDAAAYLKENESRFAAHVPTAEELENCRRQISDYHALKTEAESIGLSDGEKARYEELLPLHEAGALDEKRLEQLDCKSRELAKKRYELEMLRSRQPEQKKSSPVLPALLCVLGVGAVAAGILLLAQKLALYGGICLAVGAAAMIGGIVGWIKKPKAEETPPADAGLSAELAALEAELRRELGEGNFDKSILNLQLAASQFMELQAELQEAQACIEDLNRRSEERREQIFALLTPYFDTVEPEQFHSLLSDLQRGCERYVRARDRVAEWQARKQQHDRRAAECETLLTAFFDRFGLTKTADVREQLLRIRDDSRADWNMTGALERLRRERADYGQLHREELAVSVPEPREDPAALRLEEHRINEKTDGLSARLLHRRQQRTQLEEQLGRIPGLEDELAQWQEKYAADRKKAGILDDTMAFLEKARESLQNSYLGPVRSSFNGYMRRLLGEREEQILLTPELQVQLERKGQARELGYFSAGQTDTVMLCMRLALVDALFQEEQPFVILDDPFVNLDDNHTAQALALLRELAEEKQIIYLVCNSSRVPQ